MDSLETSRGNRAKRKRIIEERKIRRALDNQNRASTSTQPRPSNRRRVASHDSSILANAAEINSVTDDIEAPAYNCRHCGAIFWFAERLKSMSSRAPIYSKCCKQGRIRLPPLKDPPMLLDGLLDCRGGGGSKHFRENIRLYNSMFAFTSIGGKIDKQINMGQGPYVFKLNGQNHHLIGSLLPIDGQMPQYAQLYIYDTENEASNRVAALAAFTTGDTIDKNLVSELIKMFDEVNDLVKAFRMARDRFREGETRSVSLKLSAKRSQDGQQYSSPSLPEMAGLIVGDIGYAELGRDIVVEHQSQGLKRINELHPAFMAMQYPILFPYGEDGYMLNIPYHIDLDKPKIKRGHVTRREYYAYQLHQRASGGGLLMKGGKLLQQFVVDAFTCMEDERLRYIRFNHQQEHYRSEIYGGIQDAFLRGDIAGNSVGQRVILPSSFTGSPRYMIQNYHDAMAICRSLGNPDLFITFTWNVNWPEIQKALELIPGQTPVDRPDLISRVFHMKLCQFMEDIKKGTYFGRVIGAIYTVEFQKRGLPHVHIIVWLHQHDKHPTPGDIDRIISAEIPDSEMQPVLYRAVSKYMIHGPCGLANPTAPCMRKNKCTKHFPKKKNSSTIISEDGFAVYKRSDNDRFVVKNGVSLDNGFVVPYNQDLLLKYQAHVNVEWCNRTRSIKYLFKYVNKGPDRTRAFLQENVVADSNHLGTAPKVVDEIKMYVDCRYASAPESSWRIYEFHIHCKYPAVESLTVHLPLQNSVVFKGNLEIDTLLRQPGIEKTMLTEWMVANVNYVDAWSLTYTEFPCFWRWDGGEKIWFRRKRGRCIGRISYVHPSSGDRYYLRMLLAHVRGATSFMDVRTINGKVYETFKEACNALGLIGNDKEWHEAMDEAASWATSAELRQLFVTMLLFCQVVDPKKLFDGHWVNMRDDIIYKMSKALSVSSVSLSDENMRNLLLTELDRMLKKCGSSLYDNKLPEPTAMNERDMGNTLLRDELAHNTANLADQSLVLIGQLNEEQRIVYDEVLRAVYEMRAGLFFLYGHGGTGKTFVYKAIITRLRSEGKIVLAVASSGIASLLLPGGRTAHSRFKIPIDINEESTCHIKKGTQLAELLKNTSLILWDEAPMAHRHCFEALNRSMADIFASNSEEDNCLPFGGKPVLLGGDFRQILPVIVRGSRHEIVMACITKSNLWSQCKMFHLKQNMRLAVGGLGTEMQTELAQFLRWLLDIREGKIETLRMESDEEEPT